MLEVPVPLNSTEIKLEGNDCLISVVAKNRAGSSPPSRITSVDLPSGEYMIQGFKIFEACGTAGWLFFRKFS